MTRYFSLVPVTTNTHVGRLLNGTQISQSFRASDDYLYSIAFYVGTYFKQVNSILTISLFRDGKSEPSRVIKSNTVDFADNTWQSFVFEPIPDSKDALFTVTIESNAIGDSITLWTNVSIDGEYFRNDKPESGALCYITYYKNPLYHSRMPLVPAPEVERVSHLWPNDCYFAHLAVYRFASDYAIDAQVLDAGSGMGYGSAYLADKGAARVIGVDIDCTSVAYSQQHFRRHNLSYICRDVAELDAFESEEFDLIFSSNTLEHVPRVARFFYHAARILRKDGTLLVVVPPVITEEDKKHNIENPFHLNIWSPQQWKHVISHYFLDVEPLRQDFTRAGVPLDFLNTPEQSVITEEDFRFSSTSLEDFIERPSLSIVFRGRHPKSVRELPEPDAAISPIDESFTKPTST